MPSDGELTDKETQTVVNKVYKDYPDSSIPRNTTIIAATIRKDTAHAQRRKLATYLIQRSEQMYGEGNMTARWLMEEFHDLEPWPDPEPPGEGD